MNYNISYLYASLSFLIILGYHYIKNKQIKTRNNMLFRIIYCMGVLDVILDIVTSYMIMNPAPETRWILQMHLTLFYILQIIFPYLFITFTISLQEENEKFIKYSSYALLAGPILGILFALFNARFGYIFTIDQLGIYTKGPLYSVVYIYSFIYMSLAAFLSLIFVKKLSKKNFLTVWEFLVLIILCVAIQFTNGSQLTIGLGIGLGIFQFYLNTNNPRNTIDQLTDTLEGEQFPTFFDLVKQEEDALFVFVIDLYNLKEINKLYGNFAGDELLMRVAKKINHTAEKIYSFRVTGNRFLVCSTYYYDFLKRKEGIIKYLKEESQKKDTIPFDSLVLEIENAQLFKSSDSLLNYIEYLSSIEPMEKGFYHILDNTQNRDGFELYQSMETYVKQAVENDLFEVNYQPIFGLHEQRFDSLEVLTRLYHPKSGQLDTELVFEIARRKGLVLQISYLQLKKVIQFIKRNPDIYEIIDHVKFNLSPLELVNERHIQNLIGLIEESDMDGSFFQFEITEQVATSNTKEVENNIRLLTEHNIQIVLDDFGTGYSNLHSVLSLPFQTIKIDRSLLNNIESQDKVYSFYKSIVNIFHSLGYKVVSEGVETNGECEILKELQVDYLQGYYYSRPLDETNIVEFIRRKNS